MDAPDSFTVFVRGRRVATGPIEVAAQAAASLGAGGDLPLVFDDATGRPVDLDLRFGPDAAAREFRGRTLAATEASPAPPKTRGRPRLGVVAREVTLLPRHWDWLAAQPGGASAALRRLVEQARRDNAHPDLAREGREAAYRAMAALGGDLPGFEEASRALFADDRDRLLLLLKAWPADICAYVMGFLTSRNLSPPAGPVAPCSRS